MRLRITKPLDFEWWCPKCGGETMKIRLLPACWIGGQEVGGTLESLTHCCGEKITALQLVLDNLGLQEIKQDAKPQGV